MDYITIADVEKNGFYPLSKQLFNNKFYQKKVKKIKTINDKKGNSRKVEVIVIEEKLKDTTKILYSILCEQLNRSIANGWWDEERRVFVKYSLEKLGLLLNKSKDTIKTCLKELETNELLESVSDGVGKANIFYLGKIKEKPIEDIEMEYEDKIPLINKAFDKPVESFDRSKTSSKPVENVDSKPVEDFDSINYILLTNNKTTTTELDNKNKIDLKTQTEKKSSSSSSKYEFLKNYDISTGTKMNICRYIPDLTEEKFADIYKQTKTSFEAGEINSFEAVLYKALKGEWTFASRSADADETVEKDRKFVKGQANYWLSYLDMGYSKEQILNNFLGAVHNCNKDIVLEYKSKIISKLGGTG